LDLAQWRHEWASWEEAQKEEKEEEKREEKILYLLKGEIEAGWVRASERDRKLWEESWNYEWWALGKLQNAMTVSVHLKTSRVRSLANGTEYFTSNEVPFLPRISLNDNE
jgi:hypothetical protein